MGCFLAHGKCARTLCLRIGPVCPCGRVPCSQPRSPLPSRPGGDHAGGSLRGPHLPLVRPVHGRTAGDWEARQHLPHGRQRRQARSHHLGQRPGSQRVSDRGGCCLRACVRVRRGPFSEPYGVVCVRVCVASQVDGQSHFDVSVAATPTEQKPTWRFDFGDEYVNADFVLHGNNVTVIPDGGFAGAPLSARMRALFPTLARSMRSCRCSAHFNRHTHATGEGGGRGLGGTARSTQILRGSCAALPSCTVA
jgi:hypothetical protein